MKCTEAEHLVVPYIRGQLDGDELESFLEHVENCRDCREELEIYYMVEVGLRQLDESDAFGKQNFNISGRLKKRLQDSKYHIRRYRRAQVLAYAAETAAAMAALLAAALQIRIWIFP